MAERFYYGGQAVVEGVMMRGQDTSVTAYLLFARTDCTDWNMSSSDMSG